MSHGAPDLHAECDVAALVYGAEDDPDAILEAFVRDLCHRGTDAVALLQQRKGGRSGLGQPFDFVLMPDGGTASSDDEDAIAAEDTQCGTRLRTLSDELSGALLRKPDVVVLNRFGWLEANGSGLLHVLKEAVERDVPVVIAVPKGLFDRWLVVAQGLAVRLDCELASLEHWWRRVQRAPHTARPAATFCDRYK